MKGLLQSKKFRKNLSKWLLAYVGVMMLLTTVITYSRYITKYQGESNNKQTAKFNINIKELECRDAITGEVCNQDSYWSTDLLAYYFAIDTKEVEVAAKEMITLKLNKDFELVRVEEIENFDDVVVNDKIVDLNGIIGKTLTVNRTLLSDYSIAFRVESNIAVNAGKKKGYRAILKYKGNVPENINSFKYNDILKIDYVATQKN